MTSRIGVLRAGYSGLASAQQAVRGLAATLSGRTPKPLRFKYFNQCISLGRKTA